MGNRVSRRKGIATGLILGLCMIGDAVAAYPEKPVTLIVPWPPGGVSDAMMRILAAPLAKELGQPVVIVNRPGAAGLIGTHELERAAPDGYTIANLGSAQVVTQYTSKDPNSLKRVVPIANVNTVPGTLTVRADAPWNSLKEYLQYAKGNPGKLRVGNSGSGGVNHFLSVMFDRVAQITQVHIPFKGNAQVLQALLGGHIEATMIMLTDIVPMVKSGQLKLLAVGGDIRHRWTSGVPTFLEEGLHYNPRMWQGVFGPRAMPAETVHKISAAMGRVMKDPAVVKLFEERGIDLDFKGGDEYAKFVEEQDAFFRSLIEATGLGRK